MFSYKSILIVSLLAITHALPHSNVLTRQSEILGSDGDELVNIQTYNGTLGSDPIPVYYDAGLGVGNGNRPFNVSGVSYDQVASALQNSCSIQMNACADAVNDGSISGEVSDCTDQQSECQDVADTISADTEYSAKKKRDLTGEAASALQALADGSDTSAAALSSLENLLGFKFRMVRRAIQGFFDA